MDALAELMGKVEVLAAAHGWPAVEYKAWGWAATLVADTRRTVELALAAHGPDGIGDLVAAGSALGGLTVDQLGELLATMEAALGGELLAA